MPRISQFILVVSMLTVILISNILVQYPVRIWGLENLLTWAAFTYPIAFLITDITNKIYDPKRAKMVVYWGFFFAVVLSIYYSSPRIAFASGAAFIISQLLDIKIFTYLKRFHWWKAPLISSSIGSLIDTVLFFSLAFSVSFSFLGTADTFSIEKIGILNSDIFLISRWMLWGLGDFCVKLLVTIILLIPFRVLYLRLINH